MRKFIETFIALVILGYLQKKDYYQFLRWNSDVLETYLFDGIEVRVYERLGIAGFPAALAIVQQNGTKYILVNSAFQRVEPVAIRVAMLHHEVCHLTKQLKELQATLQPGVVSLLEDIEFEHTADMYVVDKGFNMIACLKALAKTQPWWRFDTNRQIRQRIKYLEANHG